MIIGQKGKEVDLLEMYHPQDERQNTPGVTLRFTVCGLHTLAARPSLPAKDTTSFTVLGPL